MKRKKATIKRTRRSPYERSLEYATKRLAKATEEQRSCQLKLESLNKEIPYLQGVIRVLTPREQKPIVDMRNLRPSQYAPSGILSGVPPLYPVQPPDVNFTVSELPTEEDQFLNVTIPGEKEVLP